MVYHRNTVYMSKFPFFFFGFQNFILILGVPGRAFLCLGAEQSDFEEIGVAGLALELEPREERERRAGNWEGKRKLST